MKGYTIPVNYVQAEIWTKVKINKSGIMTIKDSEYGVLSNVEYGNIISTYPGPPAYLGVGTASNTKYELVSINGEPN